jgi:gluconolactonase
MIPEPDHQGTKMTDHDNLQPGRCLQRPGQPSLITPFPGVQVDDLRLADVLSPDASLWCLYDQALHSEGPVWEPRHDRLVWSDVENRRLLGWYPDGRVEVLIDATFFMNGNALDGDGSLVHCEHGRRCISRSNGDGQAVPLITHYEGKRLNSPNDVTVAADGAIWFTDPIFGLRIPRQGCLDEPDLDHRSVYRYNPKSTHLARMADFEQPNGLFFAPDGQTLYVSDTSRSLEDSGSGDKHEIEAFDVGADGALSRRRFFCQTDHGVPDGFIVDKRGWLWATAGDGIHIYHPDGQRLGYIPTPMTCSNCALGGMDTKRLFIAAEKYLLAIDLLQ